MSRGIGRADRNVDVVFDIERSSDWILLDRHQDWMFYGNLSAFIAVFVLLPALLTWGAYTLYLYS